MAGERHAFPPVHTLPATSGYDVAAVSILDIAIVVVLAAALLLGFLHGLFRPLITWAFIIAGVIIGFGNAGAAARLAPSADWRPLMGVIVVAVFAVVGFMVAHLIAPLIYRRIPGVGAIDRVGGALLSGVLALVAICFLLDGMVTLDRAAVPIEGSGSTPISAAQITEIQQFVASHPGASIALDPSQLQAIESQLGTGSQPAADIGQVSTVLGILRNLHIQMVDSHVAPVIFDIGQHIPFVRDGQTWP